MRMNSRLIFFPFLLRPYVGGNLRRGGARCEASPLGLFPFPFSLFPFPSYLSSSCAIRARSIFNLIPVIWQRQS